MLDLESRLEDILARDISIASPHWMVIGRQVSTPWGKLIDLLCIDGEGRLIVLELKRDKTEREVVAQTLDYGSYVKTILPDEVRRIFAKYQKDHLPGSPAKTIEEAFGEHFRGQPAPEELNTSHELVIVAAALDAATERIVGYLADEYDVRINAVFFRVFRDGDREYLTRAWLRDDDAQQGGAPQRPPRGSGSRLMASSTSTSVSAIGVIGKMLAGSVSSARGTARSFVTRCNGWNRATESGLMRPKRATSAPASSRMPLCP